MSQSPYAHTPLETPTTPRKRGKALSVLLSIFGIMTALVSVVNIFGGSRIAANLLNAPSWAASGVLVLGLLGLLNVAAIVAIWKWRRWGVYLLSANTLAIFALNLAMLGGTVPFQGLIGGALILFCVSRKWADFK